MTLYSYIILTLVTTMYAGFSCCFSFNIWSNVPILHFGKAQFKTHLKHLSICLWRSKDSQVCLNFWLVVCLMCWQMLDCINNPTYTVMYEKQTQNLLFRPHRVNKHSLLHDQTVRNQGKPKTKRRQYCSVHIWINEWVASLHSLIMDGIQIGNLCVLAYF